VLSVFFLLALSLYSLFLTAPDPMVRGAALWLLVLVGFVGSLMLSWRDLA
jgi:hypothetical protein